MSKIIISNISNFIFKFAHVGNLDVVRCWAGIFTFLVGENINSNNGCFSRAMLSWFSGGVLGNFAWVTLEHAVTSLLDGACLDVDTV